MSGTMVQIRNVPTELHRKLKARAAIEGLSMSDFVMRGLRKALERPQIRAIHDHHAWVCSQSFDQLSATHVDRVQDASATLEQDVGEAAGARARIEAGEACGINPEGVQRG